MHSKVLLALKTYIILRENNLKSDSKSTKETEDDIDFWHSIVDISDIPEEEYSQLIELKNMMFPYTASFSEQKEKEAMKEIRKDINTWRAERNET